MALDRVEIRCTDNEKKSWELAASKTPFRKVGTWLKWLANAAADTPLEMKLTIAGSNPASAGLPEMPVPLVRTAVPSRNAVHVELDWDTKVPIVTVDGEEIPWLGEQSAPALRLPPYEFSSAVIAEIRKQLRDQNP